MGFRFYTNDGKHQVTLRVSGAQIAGWNSGAARRGMKLRPFIISAADFACILTRAIAEADAPEEDPPARDLAEVDRRAREGKA